MRDFKCRMRSKFGAVGIERRVVECVCLECAGKLYIGHEAAPFTLRHLAQAAAVRVLEPLARKKIRRNAADDFAVAAENKCVRARATNP